MLGTMSVTLPMSSRDLENELTSRLPTKQVRFYLQLHFAACN